MQIQSPFRDKPRVTNVTNVRPLPRMTPYVDPQRRPLIKALPAILARIRLFPAVNPFVHDQIVLFREALGAIRARVRLDPGVHAIVHLQLILRGKPLPAYVAQMAFLVRSRPPVTIGVVFLHRGDFPEHPEANRTLRRHHDALDVHAVISYLVRQQIARVGKAAVAHDAHERLQAQVFVVVLFVQHDVREALSARFAFVREFLQVHAVDVR